MTIQEIYQRITSLDRKGMTTLVGIDGCGGSGKTTLATELGVLDKGISVVHMDDFDLPTNGKLIGSPFEKPVGADVDWQRLERQVLIPLSRNNAARYNRAGHPGLDKVSPGGIVLIEGVFSIRNEISSYYHLTIWIECAKEIRLRRGLARDGEQARDRWEKDWIPMEERYMSVQEPQRKATVVIDGSGDFTKA
ncbi:MAG: uridine kinase [Candidatus Levybacteria bacterium]|nr:uridine kinase [Candidatus Levybacteria bacterium]